MASNARPLWSALPEGALKRQLLGEIAEHGAAEHPGAGRAVGAAAARAAGARGARTRRRDRSDGLRPAARAAIRVPHARARGRARAAARCRTSRADMAARLLLSNMAEWERLSHELHALLCDLPGEHGQLFAWLDSQLHEHGIQPWAALREGLRGTAFEALAERLMTGPDGGAHRRRRGRTGGRRRPRAAQRARLHAGRPAQGPGERGHRRRRQPIRAPWSATRRCEARRLELRRRAASRLRTVLEKYAARYNVGLR